MLRKARVERLFMNRPEIKRRALASAGFVARSLLWILRPKLKSTFNFNQEKGEDLRSKQKKSNQEGHESGSLDTLPLGLAARVVNVHGGSAISRRLMEMGVVPGAPIKVIRSAPLGDPIQVCVRNYHLALRRSEARAISVLIGI